MMPPKLYVSATRTDGSFLIRGMASKPKALEIFRDFAAARPGGRAVFTLLSQHDGRLHLRPALGDLFHAEVIARAARTPALFGLLPARAETALRRDDFTALDAESVISALFALRREAFIRLVEQEIAGTP